MSTRTESMNAMKLHYGNHSAQEASHIATHKYYSHVNRFAYTIRMKIRAPNSTLDTVMAFGAEADVNKILYRHDDIIPC